MKRRAAGSDDLPPFLKLNEGKNYGIKIKSK